MPDMNGKVALVTGASSGIGWATAKAFAARGANLSLAARREDLLAKLAAEIEEDGGRATYLVTDVSDSGDVQRLVAHTIETFGRLDYGINNAGIEGAIAPIIELEDEAFDEVIAVNLRGTFLCMKYEARAMLAAGNGGSIVNVGSVNSFRGYPGGAAYVASKHGQVGITTSVSSELAAQGIRVNIVCPGVTDTAMHRRVRDVIGDEAFEGIISGGIDMQRAGRPEEIASTIVFLCSDDASYITGNALTPDGGMMMRL